MIWLESLWPGPAAPEVGAPGSPGVQEGCSVRRPLAHPFSVGWLSPALPPLWGSIWRVEETLGRRPRTEAEQAGFPLRKTALPFLIK